MPDTRFILFQERSGYWCAAPPGFRSPDCDPVGWGPTPAEAIDVLLVLDDYQKRAEVTGWKPTLADFAFIPAPDCVDGPAHDRQPRSAALRVVRGQG